MISFKNIPNIWIILNILNSLYNIDACPYPEYSVLIACYSPLLLTRLLLFSCSASSSGLEKTGLPISVSPVNVKQANSSLRANASSSAFSSSNTRRSIGSCMLGEVSQQQHPERKKKTTLLRKLSEKRAHKYEFMQQQGQLRQHQLFASASLTKSSSSSSSSLGNPSNKKPPALNASTSTSGEQAGMD